MALDRPFRILLVEDNPADVRLTRLALSEGPATRLAVAADGEEALAMLRREAAYHDQPRPDLVLLDLNLPKKHGHEVLAEIKGDPRLSSIPVVVFSTSRYHEDIDRSYRLQANCYLTKPVQLKAFEDLVKSINDFWMTNVKLPQPRYGG